MHRRSYRSSLPNLDRRAFLGLLHAIPALQLGCATRPAAPVSPRTEPGPNAARELAELEAAYEALMSEHGLHEWSRYAGQAAPGTDATAVMQTLRSKERALVTRAAQLTLEAGSGVTPREAELWERARRGMLLLSEPETSALSDQLEATVNDFRFEHEGRSLTRGDLRRMSRSPDPAERRLQHRLTGKLHQTAAPTARALLARRRALAAQHGMPDFFEAMLTLRGVDAAKLTQLLTTLEERSREPYQRLLGEGLRSAQLQRAALYDRSFLTKSLGDFPDAAFPAEGALEFARRIWGALGVDFEQPKVRIDVRDFAFAGQAISLRVPSDVRLVVSPSPGASFYSTLLHELGHAFAATRTRVTAPVLKGYEWIAGLNQPGFDEGFAEVFGNLLDEPGVLEQFGTALPAADLALAREGRRKATLFRLRSSLMSIAFEREALRDPEQDLDALERQLNQRFLGLDIPADLEATWASSPFLATYPVYTQSYLLAALVSHQLRKTLRERFGAQWLRPEAGAWLVENVVHDGAATTLDEKLTRATGAALSADTYLAYLDIP